MRLCEDFHYHDSTDDVIISFNISSGEMNILVDCDKNWNAERGTELLNTFLRRRKLDLIGHLPWQMKKYPSAEWHEKKNPASIRIYVLNNLILICTFMIMILEYTMVHMILGSEN